MKRFMVFVGSIYYPSGGMEDFQEDFSDPFEAIRYAQKLYFESSYKWFQVYDLDQKKILLEKRYEPCHEDIFDSEKEKYLKSFSQESD